MYGAGIRRVGERLVEAHYYEFGDDQMVAFMVFFLQQGQAASAPRLVIHGGEWLEIEEVNMAFQELVTH